MYPTDHDLLAPVTYFSSYNRGRNIDLIRSHVKLSLSALVTLIPELLIPRGRGWKAICAICGVLLDRRLDWLRIGSA
jgi:hypothetical protein